MNNAIIVSIEQPRVIKKMIKVFSLANNYHSIVGSDIQEDVMNLLLEDLILDFNKHLFIYYKNGHRHYNSLSDIKSLDDALDFAKCSFIKAWR